MRNPQLKQLTTFKRRITTTRQFERASQELTLWKAPAEIAPDLILYGISNSLKFNESGFTLTGTTFSPLKISRILISTLLYVHVTLACGSLSLSARDAKLVSSSKKKSHVKDYSCDFIFSYTRAN